MFNKPEVHFAGDYFFQDQAIGTSTDAQVSEAFQLGNTEGGIRVRAWLEGAAACASGDTITATLQVGDKADSTAGTDWTDIASNTLTATGTALSGEILSVIPETEKKFMRLSVARTAGTDGMTGKFTAAVEYVPR